VRAGVRIFRPLLAAALVGSSMGVVLALVSHKNQEEAAVNSTNETIDRVMPLGFAPRRRDPMEPDPLSLRGLPAYPNAHPRRLLGAQPGAALNAISWFETDDPVEEVLGFYEKIYSDAKMVYVKQRWENRSGYISWFEHSFPEDGGLAEFGKGTLHMVSAFHQGTRTTVLFSATDPVRLLEQLSPLPEGISLPPGGRPQVINFGEPGSQRYSIFASWGKTPLEALVPDVKARAAEAGWTLVSETPEPGRVNLVSRKGNLVQQAVLEGSLSSQILMTIDERPDAASGRGESR
jgi:hypothetical protein